MVLSKCRLTVFTAAYNRGHLIERLYRALQRQTCFDFEWLVIDDGSEDNTKALFDAWMKEDNPFRIRYYHQENQGLIRALNKGIQLAQGEYLAKIDSDDYVVDDFAANIMRWIQEIESVDDVYAVAGLRVSSEGIPLKGVWPRMPEGAEYIDATDLERKNYDLDADMCEAWRTDVLRWHPFPIWEGEKFAPEQIVFHEIALEGLKIRWYPIPMSVCEYQDGGLTLGASKLEARNPMGYAMMYNHKLKYVRGFANRFRIAVQCNALSFVGGHPEYILRSNALGLSLTALLPGWMLSFRRKKQYKEV